LFFAFFRFISYLSFFNAGVFRKIGARYFFIANTATLSERRLTYLAFVITTI
jgi:hypothetical protein